MRKGRSSKTGSTAQPSMMLDQDLTIYNAQEHRRILLEALKDGTGLDLDLSRVGEIDTAGLQLLLLASREAVVAGKTLRIVAQSPAVQEVLNFLNIASLPGGALLIPQRELV